MPSMVRMSAPSWLIARARHELIRLPSTRTVQAPHWPRSHPFFVPVSWRRSRRRSSIVTRGSSRMNSCRAPFTVRLMEWVIQGSDHMGHVRSMSAPSPWPLPIRIARHCTARRLDDIRRHPPLSKRTKLSWNSSKARAQTTRCSPAWVQSNQFVIYIDAMDDHADHTRKPRADAVRNRERVLEAAKAVFSAGGPEASLEAVAKRAGVGIGTLYRHFPTRQDLFEAVYRREVEQLSE